MTDKTHGRAIGAIGPGDVQKLAAAGLTVVDTKAYEALHAALDHARSALSDMTQARDACQVAVEKYRARIQELEDIDRCPRCDAVLGTVGRGISVVAGGVQVCTACLREGEMEIMRARGIE